MDFIGLFCKHQNLSFELVESRAGIAGNERGFASGGNLGFRLPNPVKPLKVDEFCLNYKAA